MKEKLSNKYKNIAECLTYKGFETELYNHDQNYILERVKKNEFVAMTYFNNPKTIASFKNIFDKYGKNDAIKLIRSLLELSALDLVSPHEATMVDNKAWQFVKAVGIKDAIRIFKVAHIKKINMHNVFSNMPKKYYFGLKYTEKEFADRMIEMISKYSEENYLQLLQFINFAKIREAKTLKDAIEHIRTVKTAKMGYSQAKVAKAFTELTKIEGAALIEFTKDPIVVGSIGHETLCCFRSDGLAKSLLEPAIKSPISGIIHGFIPVRWFSFVWEMVTMDEIDVPARPRFDLRRTIDVTEELREEPLDVIPPHKIMVFNKNLVLDNIEAKATVKKSYVEKILKYLSDLDYSKIHCGTLRNDAEFPEELVDSSEPKPYSLVKYERNFERYGSYDDSKNLYTLNEKKVDTTAILRLMNPGDLHRCKYVEKIVYANHQDQDFFKINVEKSPSFIFESSTSIFGYLTTNIYYLWKDDEGKVIKKEKTKNKLSDNGAPEDQIQEVLYIEDLFIVRNSRRCLENLPHAFSYLQDFCSKYNIKYISADVNGRSENFIKRFEIEGLKFIKWNEVEFGSISRYDKLKYLLPTSVEVVLEDREWREVKDDTAEDNEEKESVEE
jgi:hypothetical protein